MKRKGAIGMLEKAKKFVKEYDNVYYFGALALGALFVGGVTYNAGYVKGVREYEHTLLKYTDNLVKVSKLNNMTK